MGTDKSIYERLALRFHFTRGDLPGLELFDSGTAKSDVDLVRSVFFLNLPKVAAEPKALLDLRAEAQAHGLPEFWEMIEDEYQYAQAQGQPNMARAEKIRTDFDKWNRDRFTIRGYSIGLGLVTTLAAYSWVPSTGIAGAAEAILLGAAASSLPAWFGDLNARWAGYNKAKNKAFKCMSRIDRKIG